MKKSLFLLLFVAIAGSLRAYDFQVDSICYNILSDQFNAVEVTSSNDYYAGLTHAVIPDSVTYHSTTYGVTSIGDYAFQNCNNLTSVTIGNSVMSIGINAFFLCGGLSSIVIPNSVTSIGENAFSACSSLTSVTIGNSVRSLGENAFAGCHGLTSITIPNSVTRIGDYAFGHCSGLTSLTIPSSVTSIGEGAFYGCTGLISITIPNSVTRIGDYALSSCSGLTSMNVEAGNTVYDSRDNCNAIIEMATNTLIAGCQNSTIPNGVTSIGIYAFCNCSSLTSLTIPSSVTSIGEGAFYGCTGLISITCDAITPPTLGDYVFYNVDTSIPLYVPSQSVITYQADSVWNSYFTNIQAIAEPEPVMPEICHRYGRLLVSGSNGMTVKVKNMDDSATPIADTNISSDYQEIDLSVLEVGQYKVEWNSQTFLIDFVGGSPVSPCYSEEGCYNSADMPLSASMMEGDLYLFGCSMLSGLTYGMYIFYDSLHNCCGADSVIVLSLTVDAPLPPVPCLPTSYTYNDTVVVGESYYFGDKIIIPDFVGDSCYRDTLLNYCGLDSVVILNLTVNAPANPSGTCGDSLTWEFNSADSTLTISGTGAMTDYDWNIRAPWDNYKSEIANLILPEGLSHIGNYAFYYCISLSSVTIPNSVTSIGENAFIGCSSLTSVTIGNSVTSIEGGAFIDCTSLTSVTIPNSVTSIGDYAFSYCRGLTSMTVEAGNTVYDSRDNCNAIIETATNTLIAGCQNTTIPNSVTTIGLSAFEGRDSLISVTIPSSVTNIGEGAFNYCRNLTSVTIPNSVTSIGRYAFQYCNGLTSITCEAVVPPTLGTNVFQSVDTSIPVYVPAESVLAYQSDSAWSSYFTNIQAIPCSTPYKFSETFNLCGTDSFTWHGNVYTESGIYMDTLQSIEGCDSIITLELNLLPTYGFTQDTAIYVGDTCTWRGRMLTEAGTYYDSLVSIYGCDSVYQLTLTVNARPNPFGICGDSLTWEYNPEDSTLTILGTGAMYDFASYDSVPWYEYKADVVYAILPDGLTTIGTWAFNSCMRLTSVILPNSVTRIGTYAFTSCKSMTSITIPNSVTSIGGSAFYGCSSLTSITLPNSLTNIGGSAFAFCGGLTEVTIPNSVTMIGDGAFYGCNGLTSINVEAGNTVYDSRDNCNAIIETATHTLIVGCQSTTIPNSVTSIGNTAFIECGTLISISIPNSVTSIGGSAFYGCSGLTSIICEAIIPPVLDGKTFEGVGDTIPVYVPAESVTAYRADSAWSSYFSNFVALPCETEYYATDSIAICDGMPVLWHGRMYMNSGVYVDTVQSIFGCDSICTLQLTVNPNYSFLDEREICEGDTLQWRGRNLTKSGTYTDSLVTISGCDSIYTLRLKVNPKYLIEDIVSVREDKLPYMWQGESINQSGDYRKEYTSSTGCDSVHTLHFTVTALPIYTVNVVADHGRVNGTGTYPEGTRIYLTAVPDEGFEFQMWSDGSETNPKEFVVTQDTTLRAHFFMPEVEQEVTVDSIETNSVTITWDTVPGATLYELRIYKNGELVVTLQIDKDNNIIDATFAGPERIIARKDSTGGSSETLQVNVGGLEPGQDYTYSLDAMDDDRSYVGAQSGSFTTEEEPIDRLDTLFDDRRSAPRKILRDGRLYIEMPDGTQYDARGQEVLRE